MTDDDADAPVGTDRGWAIGLGLAAVVAAVVLGVFVLARSGDDTGTTDGPAATATPTTRDLSTVTDDEMEQVLAENPDVVPMRLALVERYLREGELQKAQDHAEQAVERATTLGDRARGLRYLGWTTALLGDPPTGEGLVVQSLGLEPSDPDSLYFLGRIRFELEDDAQGALVPLEQLEGVDMSDEQRSLIDDLLARVRAAAGTGAAVTTVTTAATGTTAPPTTGG